MLYTLYNTTVIPVLSDHIKQDIFWLFRQVVAYCFLHFFHSARSNHLSIVISMSHKLMVTLNRFNRIVVSVLKAIQTLLYRESWMYSYIGNSY